MTHNTGDDNASTLSLGMMSVFALFSVFQIEKTLRQVIGVGESRAAPGSAMKSIAKTAVAFTLGKRLLDNSAKMGSGIKGISDSEKANKKTKNRYDEDVANLGLNKKSKPGTKKAETKTPMADSSSKKSSEAYEEASESGAEGTGSSSADLKTKRAYTAIQRKYEDEMKENKKKRDDAIKGLLKGTTETAGALIGAPMGLIIGGADGKIDDALRGAVSGSGVGDIVGEKIVDTGYAIKNIGKSSADIFKRDNKMTNSRLQEYITERNKQIEAALKNLDSSVDNI